MFNNTNRPDLRSTSKNGDTDDQMEVHSPNISSSLAATSQRDNLPGSPSRGIKSSPSRNGADNNSRGKINNPESDLIKIVCISDTHNGHTVRKFDDRIRRMQGDILIHAGDFGEHGTSEEVKSAFEWLCSLENFTHKIFISGNMDGIGLDRSIRNNAAKNSQTMSSDRHNVIYLENGSCEVLGIKIYGCPYTPRFFGGFQYDRQTKAARKLWDDIPENCDILISHGPPAGIFDTNSRGSNVGCYDLLQAVQQRESLKAVIFGHVHHSYGAAQQDNKLFINAAQYNGIYHGDVRNEPYEISMRRVDKSIVRVNPMPMTTDTKGSTNESNLRTPIYENRNDKNAKAKI